MNCPDKKSLPSRERGLKYVTYYFLKNSLSVAPFAGAWIEIPVDLQNLLLCFRRSLRGSVD